MERESIFKFLILGYSKSKISKKINRPRCTVTREINRNTIDGEYIHSKAQRAYNRKKSEGHYKSDTIVGKDHKGAITTYVCRKTRYLIAQLMPDRKAKTFTSDNGKEFSGFKELEKS